MEPWLPAIKGLLISIIVTKMGIKGGRWWFYVPLLTIIANMHV